MKLTIKEGKAKKIHIYIDEEYRATVDSDYWYSEKYRNYKDINEEELTELLNALSFPDSAAVSKFNACTRPLCKKLPAKRAFSIGNNISFN